VFNFIVCLCDLCTVCITACNYGVAMQLCYDIICPHYQYDPSKDVFNAAQSGAMARNLVSHQTTYLIDQLKKVRRWREREREAMELS